MTTTWAQALRWRMRQHLLDTPTSEGAVAVARRLSGVHAQVMSSAELAIAIRSTAVTQADVQAALWRDRTLVKTWAMRGTLHLLPADDLPMWVAALRARMPHMLRGSWLRYHKLSADDLHAILDTVPAALDGRCLTREALAAEVAKLSARPHLKQVLQGSWGAVLKPAAFQGLLCFGPSEGRNVTFASPQQWLADWREVDTGSALAEILHRFLDTYGPATQEDFARWFALDPRPTRELFHRLTDTLVEVDVDGHRAWMTRDGAAGLAAGDEEQVVRLLPGFDPYVVGALRHLDHLLPGPLRGRISRTSGWISPVLLVDGRIAGTWHHERRASRIDLHIDPFDPLPHPVRAAAEADASRIADLLDAPADVTWA